MRGKARGGFGGSGMRGGFGARGGRGGETLWGGGNAPIFVKAGELFKEGEVDIITIDKGKLDLWSFAIAMLIVVENHVHVEVAPLSDPSAPQMLDLRDDHEVQILDERLTRNGPSKLRQPPVSAENTQRSPLRGFDNPRPVDAIGFERMSIETTEEVSVIQWDQGVEEVQPSTQEETLNFYIDTQPRTAVVDETAFDNAFFLDVEPTPQTANLITPATPAYQTSQSQPLGQHKPQTSDEETILLKPRAYKQPQPIHLPQMNSQTKSTPKTAPPPRPSSPPRNIFIDPRALASSNSGRASKKAAKREKRIRNKTKRSRGDAKRRGELGSDIEWGSGEDAPGVMGVLGLSEDEDEEDMDVLRDYLEGTKLGDLRDKEDRDREEQGVERRGLGSKAEPIQVDVEEKGDESDSEAEGGVEEGGWETESGDDGGGDIKEEDMNSEEEGGDVVDSDDEDDSSELGDLRAVLNGESEDSDEEDSDDDIDKLFSGKDDWDETAWFIRNMEVS
jgi:hypothetical protein